MPDGRFAIRTGDERLCLPAIPAVTCHRIVPALWILHFDTPLGRHTVVVDAGRQDPRTVRGLARALQWRSGRALIPSPARSIQLDPGRPKV
jgi:hypothetical protein